MSSDDLTVSQQWLASAEITDVEPSIYSSSNPTWFGVAVGADGMRRDVFMKANYNFGSNDAEVLAYTLAVKLRLTTLRVPPCVVMYVEEIGEDVLVAERVDGLEVAQTNVPLNPDAHRELHLLDAVLGNNDRHAHNAMVGTDGTLWAIDNAGGWRLTSLSAVDSLVVDEVSLGLGNMTCWLCSWEANGRACGDCRYCREDGRGNGNVDYPESSGYGYKDDCDDGGSCAGCEVCEVDSLPCSRGHSFCQCPPPLPRWSFLE